MAGAGQPDSQPLQAGLAAQQLVTPMQPVASTDAVSALVDAFHKGIITAGDINDRIGAVAQANKRAHLEQLSEFVSPQAIQARMQQIQAGGAQAGLQTQQAQAGLGFTQPYFEAQKAAAAKQKWEALAGPAVTTGQQYAPWFGHDLGEVPQDAQGNSDYDTYFKNLSTLGQQFSQPAVMRQLAAQGLEVDPSRTIATKDPISGKEGKRLFNKWGVEVTPGGSGENFYKSLLIATPGVPGQPGATLVPPPKSAPPALHSLIQPRAALPQDNPPSGMINEKGQIEPLPQPSTEEKPVVAPDEGGVGSTTPNLGFITGQSGGLYQEPADINKNLNAFADVKKWAEQKNFAEQFDSYAKNAVNAPQGEPQIQNDLGLVESMIKLFDPQGVLREFKWDKMQDAIPWIEKLKDYKKLLLKQEALPDAARQRYINMGYDMINAAENAIRPRLIGAAQQAADWAESRAPNKPAAKQAAITAALGGDADFQEILAGKHRFTPPTASNPAGAAPGQRMRTANVPGIGAVNVTY